MNRAATLPDCFRCPVRRCVPGAVATAGGWHYLGRRLTYVYHWIRPEALESPSAHSPPAEAYPAAAPASAR